MADFIDNSQELITDTNLIPLALERTADTDKQADTNAIAKKPSKFKAWLNKNKVPIIIICILTVALIIAILVCYFKMSSFDTIISCKEELITGLNKEITKNKQEIMKLESKSELLERELEACKKSKVQVQQPVQMETHSKRKQKKRERDPSDEMDDLVMNVKSDDELDALPINK